MAGSTIAAISANANGAAREAARVAADLRHRSNVECRGMEDSRRMGIIGPRSRGATAGHQVAVAVERRIVADPPARFARAPNLVYI